MSNDEPGAETPHSTKVPMGAWVLLLIFAVGLVYLFIASNQ